MKFIKLIKSDSFTNFESNINIELAKLQRSGCEIEDIITDIGEQLICMIVYITDGGEL